MRTTIDMDLDVLTAAKERARRERRTVGSVVSDLLRAALAAPARDRATAVNARPPVYGFRPFPPTGALVTEATIDELSADDIY